MGKISILSENLCNKIAAGEVVERPASVVKELVENAIDAKSRRIFVSVLEGGTELIQVVDDGEGMQEDEAVLAFQRHATSKISTEEDLSSIRTLGFRGEALPSIASISKVRLVTQMEEAKEGTELCIEGGHVKEVKPIACPRGSSFEIRNLFYNLPARRKFLKTRQTELSHISRLLFDLALSHHKIHFRLSHGGRSLLDAPPCQSFRERLFQLFGEGILSQSMTAFGESPPQRWLSLQAFLSRPPLKKNFRKEQYLFVNLRPVKSALLSHAVYEAYGNTLMKGEAPFFVLFLTIDPTEVDLNVHPTKREVRFRNTSMIHQAVRNIIQEAFSLQQDQFSKSRDASPHSTTASNHGVDNGRSDRAGEGEASAWIGWPGPQHKESSDERVRERMAKYRLETGMNTPLSDSMLPSGQAVSETQPSALTASSPLIRPIAQVYGTFLLAEIDGELAIVDQHTAHERILYEALMNAWQKGLDAHENGLEIQPFLIPQQIDLPLSKGSVLKDHLSTLEAIGCMIEPFGETNFLIRELPALIVGMNLEAFLHAVCDDLLALGLTEKTDQPIRTIIASMACHGAIRAHQTMSLPEIALLLSTYYQRNTPPTCPHGRPIVKTYPLSELEKLFRRK